MITLSRGAVSRIELDNQPLNLVTGEMMERLDAALDELAGDREVRAVVVTGAGTRAFCAGSDVKEFEGLAGRVAQGKLLYEKYVYRKPRATRSAAASSWRCAATCGSRAPAPAWACRRCALA